MNVYCQAALKRHELHLKALRSPKPKGRAGGKACMLGCQPQCVLQSKCHHRASNTVSRAHGARQVSLAFLAVVERLKTRAYKAEERRCSLDTALKGSWEMAQSVNRSTSSTSKRAWVRIPRIPRLKIKVKTGHSAACL